VFVCLCSFTCLCVYMFISSVSYVINAHGPLLVWWCPYRTNILGYLLVYELRATIPRTFFFVPTPRAFFFVPTTRWSNKHLLLLLLNNQFSVWFSNQSDRLCRVHSWECRFCYYIPNNWFPFRIKTASCYHLLAIRFLCFYLCTSLSLF